MQTLQVKLKDGTTKTVYVHRSFQDIAGRHVYLHHNGVYGNKDGTPIRSASELEILPLDHRRLALAWWKRTGEALAAEYYGQKEEEAARNAGDFQEKLAEQEVNTRLDSVLYTRRAVSGGKARGAVSAPRPWMEFGFTRRPDWWGQAKSIAFPDYGYTMLDPEAGQLSPPDNEPPGTASLLEASFSSNTDPAGDSELRTEE